MPKINTNKHLSKQFFSFIMLFVFSFALISCEKKIDLPNTEVEIVNDFTINESIQNNSLYQQNSVLTIYGESEQGVVIVAKLLDSRNSIVSQNFATVDEKGKYVIELPTPRGSKHSYTLIVNDKNDKFVHQFDNIRFGEVFLVLGDDFLTNPVTEEIDQDTLEALSEDLFIYDYKVENGSWIVEYDVNDLTDFIWKYYNLIKNRYSCPIGFMKIIETKTYIEEWISERDIKNNSTVKQYLENNGRYFEGTYELGQMSYLFNKGIKKLSNLSFNTIIVNQGLYDLQRINQGQELSKLGDKFIEKEVKMYTQMHYMLLRTLNTSFVNCQKIALIQKGSIDVSNVGLIRNAEDKSCNYFSKVSLIPIYDLVETESDFEENIHYVTSIDNIVKRLYNIIIGKKKVSGYGNLIKEYDDENRLIRLTIEFSETVYLKINTDQITQMIEGLVIYDLDGSIINPYVKNIYNKIVIDLEIENNNQSLEVEYYEIAKIEYAQSQIITTVGIRNIDEIPIIPFVINLYED